MPKFTINDHGPDCYGLYEDGKRIAVISDCEEEVAKWIKNEMHDAPILRQKFMDACKQRDELLAALRKSLQLLESPAESFESGVCMCGDGMTGHPSGMDCGHDPVDSGLHYVGKTIEDINAAIDKAEKGADQKPNQAAPPEGWTLSKCGQFLERVGDGIWIVPPGSMVYDARYDTWLKVVWPRFASLAGARFRIPVSAAQVEGGRL